MTRVLLSVAAGTLVAVATASAHHSFAAFYFENQSVTLEGVVQEFQLRSPHALLMFAVRGEDGQTNTYTAEWGNPSRLSSQGVKRDTLQVGDVVVVTGSPGRVATEYKVHLKGIRRPSDGWRWGGGGGGRR
jgi:hypothetical protein